MNAIEIKNKAISDLQLIVDMAIEQAESQIKNDKNGFSLASFIEVKNANTPAKKERAIADYLYLSDFSNEFRDNWNFEYDNFNFECSTIQAVYLLNDFKKVAECPKKASEKIGRLDNTNSNLFQAQIDRYRRIYQESPEGKRKIKALKNNHYPLVNECWKYITNPQKIEGVTIPYEVDPVAIFTPYRECIDLPVFIQQKMAI